MVQKVHLDGFFFTPFFVGVSPRERLCFVDLRNMKTLVLMCDQERKGTNPPDLACVFAMGITQDGRRFDDFSCVLLIA